MIFRALRGKFTHEYGKMLSFSKYFFQSGNNDNSYQFSKLVTSRLIIQLHKILRILFTKADQYAI